MFGLWAWAMIVTGAFYAVTGGEMTQFPVAAAYSIGANSTPVMLFWVVTGVGEIVDATLKRRRGWGARLASGLVTTVVFLGSYLILLWTVVGLEQTGMDLKNLDPSVGLVIAPILVITVLALLPAALVNWRQAVACPDRHRVNILLAIAVVHLLPPIEVIILVAASMVTIPSGVPGPDIQTIATRVVAGGAIAIGLDLARLLRAEGRESTMNA